MSPTHAVTALQKLLIMQEGWRSVVPEMIALSLLCILYFALGTRVYRWRHMKEG
jgi:hypothetical protein